MSTHNKSSKDEESLTKLDNWFNDYGIVAKRGNLVEAILDLTKVVNSEKQKSELAGRIKELEPFTTEEIRRFGINVYRYAQDRIKALKQTREQTTAKKEEG